MYLCFDNVHDDDFKLKPIVNIINVHNKYLWQSFSIFLTHTFILYFNYIYMYCKLHQIKTIKSINKLKFLYKYMCFHLFT